LYVLKGLDFYVAVVGANQNAEVESKIPKKQMDPEQRNSDQGLHTHAAHAAAHEDADDTSTMSCTAIAVFLRNRAGVLPHPADLPPAALSGFDP